MSFKLKSYRKKPDVKQRFSSGNQVEVYIEETAPKMYGGRCEWDSFPPSQADKAEYLQKVVPRLNEASERLKARNN